MGDPTGLLVHDHGAGTAAVPVLLLHGFAQDHRCWGPLGDALAGRGRCLAVDAPGHGRSTCPADLDLPGTAALLAQVVAATGGPVDVVGYSMGGRTALQLLVDHPGTVRRAVLVGATAGIADDAERAARAAQDDATAARLEEVGLAAFLDEWLAQPMFAGLPDWARFDDVRRENAVAGLAASLRAAGTGSMSPLWDRLDRVAAPVLSLAGELDAKFCALGEQLAAALPHGELEVIPAAGHAAHLEQPDAVTAQVVAFLDAP